MTTQTPKDLNRYFDGIDHEFVPMDFVMNPATENLVFGDELQIGDVVLLEAFTMREDPTRLPEDVNPYLVPRLNEVSRWCLIERIRPEPGNSDLLSFVAIYADGSKRIRTYNKSFGWFVKLHPGDSTTN